MDEAMFSEHYEDVLKYYEKTQDDVDEYLQILKEWTIKLPFLPMEILTDNYLTGLLVRNKFSIEKTKSKIKKYFTFKYQLKHLFHEKFEEIIPSQEAQFNTPITPLTDKFERVVISRIFDPENYDMGRECSNAFMLREFLQRYDYNTGEIFVFDYSNLSAKMVSKFRPNIFVDTLALILNGYSTRIKEIHVISKLANTVMSLAKPLAPAKMIERVRFHDNIEDLQNFIPTKCLPKEYGGELESLINILRAFDKPFMKHAKVLHEIVHTMTKDEHWKGDCLPGTFRNLAVD